jgi:hypothetical protein
MEVVLLICLVIGVILCTMAALGVPSPILNPVGWLLILIAVLLYAVPAVHGGGLHSGLAILH